MAFIEKKTVDYDVVVVGGGPAGLSVASELSKELKVLVVEKEDIGTTRCSWLEPMFIAEYNEDLKNFFYSGASKFMCKTYSDARIIWEAKASELFSTRNFQEYPYIKEHEILNYWGDIVTKNESVIEKGLYIDHSVEKNRVIVKTSNGFKSAKLLIDASGHDSQVLKKYEIVHNNNYWWSVYGFIVNHPDIKPRDTQDKTPDISYYDEIHEGDYMLWHTMLSSNPDKYCSLRSGRPVLEYEVLDENKIFVFILYLTKEKVSTDIMKSAFYEAYSDSDIASKFKGAVFDEVKYGWYRSGDIPPKIARDRVTFIGDACCWSTPCGWGMGIILKNYKEFAKKTIQLVKKDNLSAKYLNKEIKLSLPEKHQFYLNKIASHFLANASSEELDTFINMFNAIGGNLCERIFTLKINHKEIVKVLIEVFKRYGALRLLKMIPKEDIPSVLKEFFYLILDLIITPDNDRYSNEYTSEDPDNKKLNQIENI